MSLALYRLDLLRRDGPGPLAFTFREPSHPPIEETGSRLSANLR